MLNTLHPKSQTRVARRIRPTLSEVAVHDQLTVEPARAHSSHTTSAPK